MDIVRRRWLLLALWLHPAFALWALAPFPPERLACEEGQEEARMRAAEEHFLNDLQKSGGEGAFSTADPELAKPRGRQWCGSGSSPETLVGRVALLMIGQAFRSRNYLTEDDDRSSCTEGTLPVQRALARNHLDMIVLPIEAKLGLQVDVFLTDTPCGAEIPRSGRQYRAIANSTVDGRGLLTQWYGPERVKTVVRTGVRDNMYQRVVGTFDAVADHMRRQGGTYEYFMFARYDVFFDKPFLSMMNSAGSARAHRGLSFFSHVHDWFFSLPGELWGCVRELWTDCLAQTESLTGNGLSYDVRRSHGCFRFGPLDLRAWPGGFGYLMLMKEIEQALGNVDSELVVPTQLRMGKRGTSAFDVRGREHRCTGSWYWPPQGVVENRSMPCYFHVG